MRLTLSGRRDSLTDSTSDQTRETSAFNLSVLAGVIVTLLGCGVAYWLLQAPPLLGAEDAAIGFRYARNLAEGHGIVFNPGGERVEGFTSVSWLLISALVYRVVGAASLEPFLLILSVGMTVVTVAIVARLLLDQRLGRLSLAVAALWVLANGGFFYWSGLSLMDVAPWAMGLALLLLLVDARLTGREARWASFAPLAATVVFLVLTRPESMLVVPGAVAVAFAAYPRSPAFKRLAAEVLGVTAVSVGLLTAFRLAYFGVPLPNTYYTKVSPDVLWRVTAGFGYLREYAAAHSVGWALFVAIGACLVLGARVLLRRGRGGSRAGVDAGAADAAPVPGVAVFVSGFMVVGAASIVWGGGDHYQGHRFLQSWLVLGAVPLAVAVELAARAVGRRDERGATLVAGAAVLVLLALMPAQWTAYRDHGIRQQAIDVGMQGRFVGATMTQVFDPPRPELGLWMVGGASYTYEGPVKDLLGLNWIAMGMSEGDRKGPRDHAAFNVDVFWSAPPDVMIPEPEVLMRGIGCVRLVMGGVMRGLLTSDRFLVEFEPVRIARGDSEPMVAYARSGWLSSAPPSVTPLGWDYCG